MAYEALKYYSDRAMTFRFVSNVDSTDFVEATRDLDAAETLFIISSKTFTTLGDHDQRAHRARLVASRSGRRRQGGRQAFRRRLDQCGKGRGVRDRHRQHVRVLGLGRRTLFDGFRHRPFDHAAIGPDHFRAMLEGFHAVDEHFRTAPFARNLPVLMGLFGVWYNDFFGAQTVAVLPYDQYLKRFPAYLQQLTMESNGARDARRYARGHQTGPIYWGEPGTNGQHSFYQLIHQGTRLIPCDFVPCTTAQQARPASRHAAGERICTDRGARLRQARAGQGRRHADWLVPHRVFEGNRPSNTIVLDRLTGRARETGCVRAQRLYQGTIWDIDSFDQWGVELGKVLAQRIIPELEASPSPSSATTARPTI